MPTTTQVTGTRCGNNEVAGVCTEADAIDCSPCGICHPDEGCIRGAHSCSGEVACDEDADRVKLKLRTSPRDGRRKLKLDFVQSLNPIGFRPGASRPPYSSANTATRSLELATRGIRRMPPGPSPPIDR